MKTKHRIQDIIIINCIEFTTGHMSIIPYHRNNYALSGWTAEELTTSKAGKINISLDLGLSSVTVDKDAHNLCLPDGGVIEIEQIVEAVSKPEDCITIEGRHAGKIYFFSEEHCKYYKLFQYEKDQCPTIVINNATMHRIKGVNPWSDVQAKINTIPSQKGGKCFDTCCGMGYSAQVLASKFHFSVVTCERDKYVLETAALNPWSKPLFTDSRITIQPRDMRECLPEFPDNYFNMIFHDPPTIFQAGELYSEELYNEFARVIRTKGFLYHYIGTPGKKQGKNYSRGIANRLKNAGFYKINECYGGLKAIRK